MAHGNQIANEKGMKDRQNIIDSGRSQVITLTDAERQQWVEVMKPVWGEFQEQIGQSLIDAAVASNQ